MQGIPIHGCGRTIQWAKAKTCIDVMLFSALHNSTWSQEGFQTLASAHALCLTTSYSCLSISDAIWRLRISGSIWKLSRSLEVIPELNVVQSEMSVEVKNKARSLEVTRIISRSLEQRVEVQGGSRWG